MRTALVALLLAASVPSLVHAQARAGGEFRVNAYTTGGQGGSSVTADAAGRFVVVWSSVGQDGSSYAVVGRRFDAAGAPLGGEFVVNQFTTGAQNEASVAAVPDGGFMVTWLSLGQDGSGNGVFGRVYRSSGEPIGPEFPVNTSTLDSQVAAHVAAIPGGFVVVWASYNYQPVSQVFGSLFNLRGERVGREFVVGSPAGYRFSGTRAAGLPNGAYVVTWVGPHIYYRVFDTSGPLGPTAQADEVVSTPGLEIGRRSPDVLVRDDGSFTLAWDMFGCVAGDGIFCDEMGVRGRDFNPVGAPVGGEYQVSQSLASFTPDPQLAVSALGVQLGAWSAAEIGPYCFPPVHCDVPHTSADGSVSAVVARRFGPVLSGPPFVVNSFTTGAQFAPAVASDPAGNVLITWTSDGQDGSGAGVYAQRYGGLRPAGMDVDTTGNHVLEPGESVDVRPSWRNVAGSAQAFSGTFSGLTGPLPGNGYYTLTDGAGDYGTAPDGATVSCTNCYGVSIADLQRPSVHWDASVVETISPDIQGQQVRWPLHIGKSFTDVPTSNPFYRFIEMLLHRGVTAGCTGTTYCPSVATTREQMAVFVLVAKEGAGYAPPACVPPNIFNDVPETSPFCRYIEELANRGVVGGCATNQYCGSAPVTREQMAVFVLRTLDPTLDPPACAPPNMFTDMPETSPFCRWVEELARRGIVAGCGGGNYCGGAAVTREQMGVFLGVTFGLTLYGV